MPHLGQVDSKTERSTGVYEVCCTAALKDNGIRTLKSHCIYNVLRVEVRRHRLTHRDVEDCQG